jgi:chaperonin cofactor prefoldin
MVKSAVEELQPAGSPDPVIRQPRQNQAEQRKLIAGAIGELLVLLSQKASHEALTQKVEALHGQIQALFPKASSKK